MATYRRVVITVRGGPEVVELVEEEVPVPGPGEVLVRSVALAVSGYDGMLRRRSFPGFPKTPFTPGTDVVGVVESVGPDTDGVETGTLVAGLLGTGGGGHAEYVCIPAERLVPVPPGTDVAEAASIAVNFVTAATMMRRAADVQPGERVLVHGAAGGTGSAIVQLGALDGLEMYGTASARKHDFVRSLGAIPIDYRTEDFVERIAQLTDDGVDVVFDPIGGSKQLRRSYRVLRPGGRLVWYGVGDVTKRGGRVIIGSLVQRLLLSLRPDGKKAPLPPSTDEPIDWYRETLAELLGLAASGKLQPAIAARVPFSDVRRAHELFDAGDYTGAIVLTVEER